MRDAMMRLTISIACTLHFKRIFPSNKRKSYGMVNGENTKYQICLHNETFGIMFRATIFISKTYCD